MQIVRPDINEDIFTLIGLDSFFKNDYYKEVNWEEFFQLIDKKQINPKATN